MPDTRGVEPAYDQTDFDDCRLDGGFGLVASPDARDGFIAMHQNAEVHVARLRRDSAVDDSLAKWRLAWLQFAWGEVSVAGEALFQGDGLAVRDADRLTVSATEHAEILLFDMAA